MAESNRSGSDLGGAELGRVEAGVSRLFRAPPDPVAAAGQCASCNPPTMSHEEAELREEPLGSRAGLNEAVEADLEPRPHHRRRHGNGGGRVRGSCGDNGERQHHTGPAATGRYRSHDASGGAASRPHGQRRSVEESEGDRQEPQHAHQPLPRPGVARYRRQSDHEARLRAQQQRQRQREVERGQPQPQAPPPNDPPPPQAPPAQDPPEDEDGEDSALARSASTESGFHNHTDRAEGDADMALEADGEDEGVYSTPYRPESEEYTESAEAEQHGGSAQPRPQPRPQPQYPPMAPPLPQEPLPNLRVRPAATPSRRGRGGANPEDEPYAEPYGDYGAPDHVYEEIGDEPPTDSEGAGEGETAQQRRAGFRLFEQDSYRQQEAVGSRLHHYDERSDGESDSPEKEAEFAPYPRMDSCDQEEDIDQIVAEVRESLSSQSLDQAAGDWPESGHDFPGEQEGEDTGEEHEEVLEEAGDQALEDEQAQPRQGRLQRDAISLAIKDIKEAIEEVKTRTVRSPYTPDEPTEPIWVMRQDLSPTGDCDLQPPPGGDSPRSTSPQGAESSEQLHEGSGSFESPSPADKETRRSLASFPTYVEVPGPCDPEDLIDGIIFAANYLGSTQLLSDKTPSKNVRMMQAQEAVSRIKQTAQKLAKNRKKAPEGDAQPMTEVDLFISTQRIRVLNADTQENMMDHPLRTISYIADIGNIVVLMARRRMARSGSQENVEAVDPAAEEKHQYKMICHVFESEDAQLIAQSIGQAFSVAYQEFLRANGINPEDLSQKEYSDLMNTQDMYNDDLIHFSKSENCKDVYIEKQKGEILGVVIVESGWGSILPTVIIANMMHAGPAEKSGRLNIGDQIMSINGTSLVGLPLSTCQSIIKALKTQSRIKLNIVRCPPVTTVLIRRPDLRYQLGFSVQNGIICSLMRGGIAERGGVRVGHRIIEINGQSVVATPHEKIVHILSNAVGEIHMKTMPAAMYRLLTAQEQPVYI
ncbi:hypothetical protein GJAV_G00023330 [Gymnothorax javanicus]|nr:hypothetical protein GJAV_G00023330 [Gymnothorax javanicus]